MKKIFLLTLMAIAANFAPAQQGPVSGSTYSATAQKQGDMVAVEISSDLHNVYLHSRQMLVLTPEIRSNDGRRSITMAPVAAAGNRQYRMTERELGFGEDVMGLEPQTVIRHKKISHTERAVFDFTTPYEEWMADASLIMNEKLVGCVRCDEVLGDVALMTPIFIPPFVPQYRVTFVNPPTDDKVRKEVYVARINYEVGRHVLLRNYKNNAAVLAEVDKVMKEITGDDNLTVDKFTVTGYASPEGNYNSNMVLSRNRAKAFMDYLSDKFGWNVARIDSEGRGEDWEGLYKAVQASSIDNRAEVLSIIDNNADVAQRKARLQALNGGTTYRMLLNEYYPPLRRNEYEIDYTVKPFSIEESKEIIKTKPRQLSLNELYTLANSYPKGSEEFNHVLNVASAMYPEDTYAKVNSAAYNVELGLFDRAIENVNTMTSADALNNLGVAYANKGDYNNAKKYLQQAIDAGNEDASYNMEQLEKAFEE